MIDGNSDLRKAAVTAISNYMHHELFGITQAQAREMLPWITDQASELLSAADRAIKKTYEMHAEMKAKGLL